ncbi:MAG: CDP-alcohol phosphatidyltransferase family protein [Actinomycetota bacterium]
MKTPQIAKERDYWWTVLAVDPLAIPLTRFLARTRWLSPDQVSAGCLVLGLLVGPVYLIDGRWGLVAGAILFYLAFLLDCVDGKLARARGTGSARGEILDELADNSRKASVSMGLAVRLWSADPAGGGFWWAVGYGVVGLLFAMVSGGTRGEPGTSLGGGWSRALARRRLLPTPGTPDVGAIVSIFGPLTGAVVPALVVGDALLVLATALVLSRRLRRSEGSARRPK